MINIIAGTAGHIDHGKTALVRALTGVDTDRLKEEKERGISIELGFAHLDLTPELRVGFVDVPGHERFVKNMLAGVGGIDLVLLVIAADESIKPQTREHFDICRLLNIPRGIVVLTKADLVDPEILDLVRLEAEEFVQGSFLEGAPVVAVSSVTGQGLAELRGQLERLAAGVPGKDSSRHFRLPVDRSFTMRGFGTVITGTLISGSVAVESEVEAHPSGKRLRVRGVQVHGQAVERALAGQRTALNLAGADPADLPRGSMLTSPGLFQPTRRIDCRFDLLPSAKPLRHRAPVHFHAGTAEVEAEVRLLEGLEPLKPGSRGLIRFLLREPLQLLPGDRFIVRMFSPVVTIGGGTVLDIAAPVRLRRAQAASRLKILSDGSVADRLALLLREEPFGTGVDALAARTGLTGSEIEAAGAAAGAVILRGPQTWLVDRTLFDSTTERLKKVLAEFHRKNPLVPGLPREELRSRELAGAPSFFLDAIVQASPEITAEGEVYRRTAHKLALKEDEEQALAKIEKLFQDAGLAVPAVQEVLSKAGVEPGRARSLLQILLRQRRLARISEDLMFHHSALESLKQMLAGRKGQRFAVPVFKEWTGISRKYAIPLLEYLDRERVTRRDGDTRVVL